MYRHDPALTATSPLRGGLAEAPRVAWWLDLGGPRLPTGSVLVRDVTGDGRDEFLTLADDAVTCRDSRGRLLGASAACATRASWTFSTSPATARAASS
jgi:hypothetical protein